MLILHEVLEAFLENNTVATKVCITMCDYGQVLRWIADKGFQAPIKGAKDVADQCVQLFVAGLGTPRDFPC